MKLQRGSFSFGDRAWRHVCTRKLASSIHQLELVLLSIQILDSANIV